MLGNGGGTVGGGHSDISAGTFPLDASENSDNDGDGIGDNADSDDDNENQSDADEVACDSDSCRYQLLCRIG